MSQSQNYNFENIFKRCCRNCLEEFGNKIDVRIWVMRWKLGNWALRWISFSFSQIFQRFQLFERLISHNFYWQSFSKTAKRTKITLLFLECINFEFIYRNILVLWIGGKPMRFNDCLCVIFCMILNLIERVLVFDRKKNNRFIV